MPTKSELIEKLKEKGIEANDSLSKDNLEELLAQANGGSQPEVKTPEAPKVEEKVYLGEVYVENVSDSKVKEFQKEEVLKGWDPKTRIALIKQ